MSTISELSLGYLKARMKEENIISFSLFQTIILEIKNNILHIKVEKNLDMESILKKKDKLNNFEKEIGMKIVVGVK